MKIKVNRKLVPVKAHFFFFFAALGPILPQLNVFGRQLGVSPGVMGMVTAVLPLLWAAAKPLFGYVVDFWPNHRKLVFMLLIVVMTGSYCGLWFIPMPASPVTNTLDPDPEILEYIYKLNDTVSLQQYDEKDKTILEKYTCYWSCARENTFQVYLRNSTYINTIYVDDTKNISCSLLHMVSNGTREKEMTCIPKDNCNLLCFEDEFINTTLNITKREVDRLNLHNVKNNLKDFGEASQNNKTLTENDNSITKVINEINNNDDSTNNNALFNNKDYIAQNKNASDDNTINKNASDDNTINENASDDNTINKNASDDNTVNKEALDNHMISIDVSKESLNVKDIRAKISKVVHSTTEEASQTSFYMTAAFWTFVVLMCIGTVAFNVANCIGDAVCFDVLGPEHGSSYGWQRAWGTAGYGGTALAGGWLVDAGSRGAVKDFTPAFVLALAATAADLYSCTHLKLPSLSSPDDSGKALREVLKIPRVVVFIIFAVVAGTFDSFIIYYMFWFLEELAEQTGHTGQIKLIEGVVVAGQSFVGELLFFALSGKIINRFGYGTTMTMSLFCYGVRMALISLIQHPWQLVFIESIMQGPTYALCYSTIVGYAAHVAPEGYSATVQGIVAGMDDGVGFALGSLVGGALYGWAGGRGSFRIFAVTAGIAALLHAALFRVVTGVKVQPPPSEVPEGEKMLPVDTNAVYRDTVEPLTEKNGGR